MAPVLAATSFSVRKYLSREEAVQAFEALKGGRAFMDIGRSSPAEPSRKCSSSSVLKCCSLKLSDHGVPASLPLSSRTTAQTSSTVAPVPLDSTSNATPSSAEQSDGKATRQSSSESNDNPNASDPANSVKADEPRQTGSTSNPIASPWLVPPNDSADADPHGFSIRLRFDSSASLDQVASALATGSSSAERGKTISHRSHGALVQVQVQGWTPKIALGCSEQTQEMYFDLCL